MNKASTLAGQGARRFERKLKQLPSRIRDARPKVTGYPHVYLYGLTHAADANRLLNLINAAGRSDVTVNVIFPIILVLRQSRYPANDPAIKAIRGLLNALCFGTGVIKDGGVVFLHKDLTVNELKVLPLKLEPHPLHFGKMEWKPELIRSLPLSSPDSRITLYRQSIPDSYFTANRQAVFDATGL